MFHEEVIDLGDYFHIVRKRWRMIVIIFLLTVTAGTIMTLRQPSVYMATACILIETEAPNVLTFQEVLDEDTKGDYYQTQYDLLKSPTLAERVLKKLGMLGQPEQEKPQPKSFSIRQLFTGILELSGLRKPPPSPEVDNTTVRERRIIENFLRKITIRPIKKSRLVNVIANSTDPKETALFANALAEAYIEQQLELKLSTSKNAVRWLEKEVETNWKKLQDSEVALQAYKDQHAIISFEGRENIVTQKLLQLGEAVNKAKIRRIGLETEYKQIQRFFNPDTNEEWELEELESIPQVIGNSLVQQLKVKLALLESEFSELQKTFRSKHPDVIALQSQITSIQDRIYMEIKIIFDSISKEYRVALEQELELVAALEQQKGEALELDQKALMYEALQREVQSNRNIYAELLQRAKEASVSERLETSNIRIVDRATIPISPIGPNKKRNILIAMIGGLFIGGVLSFLLESFDKHIRTPADIKQYLDIPCLGSIPKVSHKGIKGVARHDEARPAKDVIVATIVVFAPRTMISEAYRSLRTNLISSSPEQGSVLLITSAGPGEGKSGLVANLGIALAQSGKKTLIIDCDFRKPIMHKIFCLKNSAEGFSDIIKNAETPGTKRPIQRTDVQNLFVMPCGEIPPNPSELLESTYTRRHIEALGQEYDKILIDSPPVNVVTDPVILSRFAQEVILVVHAGKTNRGIARYARDQLRNTGAKLIGGVLNSVDIKKDHYYDGYHYTHT
jgi:capsular exopolysaccharide synthesis family protein